jgi:galactokinase
MKEPLVAEFQKRYSTPPEHLFFCPGRVNLIGEHIDYNGGLVMPCAITKGTWLALRRNTDKRLRFQSLNFPETAALRLQHSYSKTGSQWFNFPLGVIHYFLKDGYTISGLDMLFGGNLPVGSGLSSSASIEVAMAVALNDLFQSGISKNDLALLCKKVENEFMGVNCGIMDQYAVIMGKKHHAMLLNCDTLDFEYIPFETKEYSLVIIDTKKERTLVGSKYNERFAECGAALKALKQKLPVQSLCDLDVKTFEAHRHFIGDAVLEKRALHAVSENERVKQAALLLKEKNFHGFGKLMFASHQSLKEHYEVTAPELDFIADFGKEAEGCLGARMTGAGFGGCAIALVEKRATGMFVEKLARRYSEQFGRNPEIFVSEAGDGAREIKA